MTNKNSRPKIPLKTQLKLWVCSGGRCEFSGCNELVYRDNLTLSETNWSNISHIVAYSENGPRGNVELSPKLAIDFSNLILTCSKHGKLIDDESHVHEYSVKILSNFKQNHEKRIRTLTAINSEFKTHTLAIQSNIGNNAVQINARDVNMAIAKNKMYPSEEQPFFIDLARDTGRGNTQFYKEKARQISASVRQFLEKFNASKNVQHISVFPLALIPLLVYFGKELGDKYPIQLFQYHRNTGNWTWKSKRSYPKYLNNHSDLIKQKKDVYLKISLSDSIEEDKLHRLTKDLNNIYEITIPTPAPYFLVNKNQLVDFKFIYRQTLNAIQRFHGIDCTIHLLLAVPCPIAVICGTSLLPRKEPKIIVYDYDSEKKGFTKALTI